MSLLVTSELRKFSRNMPKSRVLRHIRMARDTMRQPTYYGPHLVNGKQGPDYIYCARSIAVMRADLKARAAIAGGDAGAEICGR